MIGLPKPATGWLRDWFGRSATLAAEKGLELNPTILLQAGGLVAYVFSGELLDLLPADLPPARTIVLRVVLSLVMLVIANYVVTAKDAVPGTPEGWGNKPAPTQYRYRRPEGERLFLKLTAGLLVLLWGLVYWPTSETPTCRLLVSVESTGPAAARPIYIATRVGERELGRLSASVNQPVALDIPGVHVSSWSLAVGWNDGTTSRFQGVSGCPKETALASEDGKAKLRLRPR